MAAARVSFDPGRALNPVVKTRTRGKSNISGEEQADNKIVMEYRSIFGCLYVAIIVTKEDSLEPGHAACGCSSHRKIAFVRTIEKAPNGSRRKKKARSSYNSWAC